MKRFVSIFLAVVISISCFSITSLAQRDISKEELLAQELKELGLFKGVSDTDFDLDRAPSRVEAVVMLIRVLGKEKEVLNGVWRHPFTDVPSWADKYIGYAYSNGLTNGQSLTEFGVGDASAAVYTTFVLRALGYSDANGKDFVWNDPFTLARQIGIITDTVNVEQFWRADVVLISHAALNAYLNGFQQTLAQKLIESGVFTQGQFDRIYNSTQNSGKVPTNTNAELSAEEIYAKCSPTVFYIEIYDDKENVISSGSGFFISDYGVAVTNYHVIDEAYSAWVQLSDSGNVYEVNGVYAYDEKNDWAIIDVNCKNNKYLEIGDPSTVVGASTVYAIGSPLGLQNTISQGLISNPSRLDGGVEYIQISAAISHGSSGGALLNKYGEVIGITSAGYDGQNLNLAIPMKSVAGYSLNSLITLADFNEDYYTNKSTDRKQEAFTLLKDYIIVNAQDSGSLGYEYSVKIDTEDGWRTFSLFYDEEEETLYVENRIVFNEDGEYYSFQQYVNIDINYDQNFARYYFSKYADDEGLVTISEGSASIECAEFDSKSQFSFYEYKGEDRNGEKELSQSLICGALDYINVVFSDLAERGFEHYTVQDLGYTSYPVE